MEKIKSQCSTRLLAIVVLCTLIYNVQLYATKNQTETEVGFEKYETNQDGKAKEFQYDLDLQPVGQAGMMMRDLANQNLLIFNFSAKCSHCRAAAPYFKKLLDTLSAYGFIFVGIGASRNDLSDIQSFIKEFKLEGFLYKDYKRDFAKKYGTNSLPTVAVIGKNGTYMRGPGSDIRAVVSEIKKAVFEKQLFP